MPFIFNQLHKSTAADNRNMQRAVQSYPGDLKTSQAVNRRHGIPVSDRQPTAKYEVFKMEQRDTQAEAPRMEGFERSGYWFPSMDINAKI